MINTSGAKKRGNYQKNCIEFFKYLNKQGEDHVTFVDESLFLVMQNLQDEM
jgi:hypothetical protein